MIKISQHIEIVRSSDVGLSSMSQASCNAVFDVLSAHYASVGVSVVNDESDLQKVIDRQPDVVWLGVKYVSGTLSAASAPPTKVWVAAYFMQHGIATTGSSHLAHQLEFDKPLAKQRVLEAGLATAAFSVVASEDDLSALQVSYPVFIKPTNLGGGAGIDKDSLAFDLSAARNKIRSLLASGQSDVLIESYLPGREFSVAVLKHESSSDYLAMPIELVAPLNDGGVRLLSQHVKSSDLEVALPVTDAALRQRVSDFALKAFQALAARDYGRIDIRLDAAGTPHFLEANLVPSVIDNYGSFPKACKLNAGLGYEAMILQIVRLAAARALPEPVLPAEPRGVLPLLLPVLESEHA